MVTGNCHPICSQKAHSGLASQKPCGNAVAPILQIRLGPREGKWPLNPGQPVSHPVSLASEEKGSACGSGRGLQIVVRSQGLWPWRWYSLSA